jgi:hypothetical protein
MKKKKKILLLMTKSKSFEETDRHVFVYIFETSEIIINLFFYIFMIFNSTFSNTIQYFSRV